MKAQANFQFCCLLLLGRISLHINYRFNRWIYFWFNSTRTQKQLVINLQPLVTHLTIAVESLLLVRMSRCLCCKLSIAVDLYAIRSEALCLHCLLGQQVVFETPCIPVISQTPKAGCSGFIERTILKLNLPWKTQFSLSISVFHPQCSSYIASSFRTTECQNVPPFKKKKT